MKKLLLIALFCAPVLITHAQYNQQEPPEAVSPKTLSKKDPVYKIVEHMPEFPGGEAALYKYISDNVQYPDTASKYSIQGHVKIRFVIDEQGMVTDVHPTTNFGYGLEDEAMRVIKSMPSWQPAMNNGVPVKVYYMIPINFELPKEEAPKK